jgi:hypothetical protein
MRAAPADPALLLVPEPAVPLLAPEALPETGPLADTVA